MRFFSSIQYVCCPFRQIHCLLLLIVATASLCLPCSGEAGGVFDTHPPNVTVSFSPQGDVLENILKELKRSKFRIDVNMFYISNDHLIDALCYMAGKKQIRVRMVVDEFMNTRAHRKKLEVLVAHGVEIYVETLPKNGKMHLKCVVIDEKTVITGAANWTEYAFRLTMSCPQTVNGVQYPGNTRYECTIPGEITDQMALYNAWCDYTGPDGSAADACDTTVEVGNIVIGQGCKRIRARRGSDCVFDGCP